MITMMKNMRTRREVFVPIEKRKNKKRRKPGIVKPLMTPMAMKMIAAKESKYILPVRYAVWDKVTNSVVLAPYGTKEEAKEAGIKYGFFGDQFYIDKY